MLFFPPLMLLVSSLAAGWQWRPVSGWSGAAASLFMAALLGLVTSVLLIADGVFAGLSSELLLVLQQALLFAGVPLVAAVWMADAAGQDWDRVIWGRILLGLCAVFEICRRSGWLDHWLLIALCSGLLASSLITLHQSRWLPLALTAGIWGAAAVLVWYQGSQSLVAALVLFTSLLRLKTAA